MNAEKLNSLTVYRNLLNNNLIIAYNNYLNKNTEENYGKLFYEILNNNAEENFLEFFTELIVKDENIFTKTAALNGKISKNLKTAVLRDFNILNQVAQNIIDLFSANSPLNINKGEPFYICKNFYTDSEFNAIENLIVFYSKTGYGKFAFNKAFKLKDNQLCKIENPVTITLNDLKEYTNEKKEIAQNIEAFLKGFAFNNMLLYGDKGTGKSSTIHAMVNNYFNLGLRIVEVSKSQIPTLAYLFDILPEKPLKFIVFIDDLTLSDKEDNFSILKAVLEGSFTKKNNNIMVCATSNRRHIISESFSDRDNDIHLRDTLEEQLSLADRFGLSILFDSPDKKGYLSIVSKLAKEININIADEELEKKAEIFAQRKGGRSPRRARQFIDNLLIELSL